MSTAARYPDNPGSPNAGITMDTLTHALSGALLARASYRPTQILDVRRRCVIGTLAAAQPDIDILFQLGGPFWYLDHHRGITHSVLLWPLWTWMLAWLSARIDHNVHPPRAYAGVIALGILAHIGGDVITAYGTQILAPLSAWKAAWPITFSIEPYFSGILLLSLLWARGTHATRRACIGLAVFVGYLAAQAGWAHSALGIAHRYATQIGLPTAACAALPQPLSPLRWKLVVVTPQGYRSAYLDFFARKRTGDTAADTPWLLRLAGHYRAPDALVWHTRSRYGTYAIGRSAWNEPAMAPFRRFAQYPSFDTVTRRSGVTCTWFYDLRFELPGRAAPFRYGLCRDARHGVRRLHSEDK